MRVICLTVLVFAVGARWPDVGESTSGAPIRPESKVWITGASNIRRFTCSARQLSGALELRGIPTQGSVLLGQNSSAAPSISVTVKQLDCGIGVMSRHLQQALSGARYPSIDFRLTAYEADLTPVSPVARITGVVTIAGVQRPVATTAILHEDSLGYLHVEGTYALRPTEFGVAPPRRFGGLLRVRDHTVVHFDVALDPVGGLALGESR